MSKTGRTPLDDLPFPVVCEYCGDGPFSNAIEVDEHISESHLPEAVWGFAADQMRRSPWHECYCKLGGMPHEICVCGKCGKESPRGTMRPMIDEHPLADPAPVPKEPACPDTGCTWPGCNCVAALVDQQEGQQREWLKYWEDDENTRNYKNDTRRAYFAGFDAGRASLDSSPQPAFTDYLEALEKSYPEQRMLLVAVAKESYAMGANKLAFCTCEEGSDSPCALHGEVAASSPESSQPASRPNLENECSCGKSNAMCPFHGYAVMRADFDDSMELVDSKELERLRATASSQGVNAELRERLRDAVGALKAYQELVPDARIKVEIAEAEAAIARAAEMSEFKIRKYGKKTAKLMCGKQEVMKQYSPCDGSAATYLQRGADALNKLVVDIFNQSGDFGERKD